MDRKSKRLSRSHVNLSTLCKEGFQNLIIEGMPTAISVGDKSRGTGEGENLGTG